MNNIEYISLLYKGLQTKLDVLRRPFDPDNYRWIIGISVIDELSGKYNYVTNIGWADKTKQRTLFDIPLIPDYAKTDNIQLWENITDRI